MFTRQGQGEPAGRAVVAQGDRAAGFVCESVVILVIKLGYINAKERDFLVRQGAVGEIAGRWIDTNGLPIKLPETINPIGISLGELQRIPNRLTVAGGREKTQAIRAILNGRLTTHLVTDEYTAQELLS